MDVQRLLARGRTAYRVVDQLQLSFLAAAIAYYAFVSVVPLLLVGFGVASLLAGDAVATRILGITESVLAPEATRVLEQALRDGTGRTTTLVGLVVLLWSGLRLFRGLDVAFAGIYGAETPKGLPGQVRDAVVTLVAIAVAIAGTALAGALIPVDVSGVGSLFGTVGMALVLSVVFFPLYYVLPDRDLSVREVVPGALLAGVGWTALGTAFGLYAEFVSVQVYGVLGAVLLLILWFYFGGLVVLLGATLNAVRGGYVGDRQLQQATLRGDG